MATRFWQLPGALEPRQILEISMSKLAGSDSTTTRSTTANIVLVTGSLRCGGAERVLSDMANYWAERNWQVTFATWSGPEVADFYAINPSVRRVWLDVDSPNNSSLAKLRSHSRRIRKLRNLLSDSNPDAVLSFIDWSNVLTIIAASRLRTRVVVSERIHAAYNIDLSWPWKRLRKFLYSRANAVVAQTDDAARWLRKTCSAKVCAIPNPLRNLPELAAEREMLILAVGRLNGQKGFDLLLRAFAGICCDFEGWSVVIAGAGPEESNLLRLRDQLKLNDRVQFVAPVQDIESLMSRAGLVVQPSRFEGFPNVILEAMGMGAPVISANCPSGPAEIIQDGINGRLVPVGDFLALAEAMKDLMSQPELRARLGKEALKVRQQFRQESIMELWEECLIPEHRSTQNGDLDMVEVSIERRQ